MQSGAGTATQPGVNSWSTTLPTMYPNNQQQQSHQQPPHQQQQQQRHTSNPRNYGSGESPAIGSERRDDQAYTTPDQQGSHQQYANYQQQQGYAGVPNYGQYNSSMNSYTSPSPNVAAASGSRRTSGPKVGTTPPAINTQAASARYYPGQSSTEQQYPASAPPNVTSHSQQPQHAMGQQGTMSAHASYYYPPESYYAGYQTPSTSRSQPQSTPASGVPTTATMDPQRSGSSTYDYSQPMPTSYPAAQYPYQWPQQSRSSMPGQTSQWQGYPMNSQPMPHGYPSQMQQYPMHSWQGYYPPGAQPHPSTMAPMSSKKGKDKGKDDYKTGSKRLSEAAELSPTDKKGKKLKKDEEKPVVKAPPKSHLKAPPQAQSMWQLFFTDELNKAKAAARATSPGGTVQNAKLNVAKIAQEAGIAYNKLNDEQKAYYGAKVAESKAEHEEALKNWHKTLTPEDIRKENVYRAQMRKEGKSRKGNLKDPNAPKKPLSAYFLFLKGIRENDDLRAEVWGKETETTKQSVLAAERWRGLSDDERRPFLNQAENDKQTYESARKIYEEEAAARARGELVDPKTDPNAEASTTVPPIPIAASSAPGAQTLIDVNDHVLAPPTPQLDTQTPQVDAETSPDFAQFTHDSDEDKKPQSSGFDTSIDDFQGFPDPLQDMDLTGLEGMTSGGGQSNQQWDDLHNLMGEQTSSAAKSDDVDEAPTMQEAVAETSEMGSEPVATNESDIQQVAAEAEGTMGLPDAEPVEHAPTEAVSEMPQPDVPVSDGQDYSFDMTTGHGNGDVSGPALDGTNPPLGDGV